MTKDNLATAKVGITLEESKAILHERRIEKLLVVDDAGKLQGLITIKDIEKIKKYPNSCKDNLGRLRVGAAIGVGPDMTDRVKALMAADVDVIVVDTAHGHSLNVINTIGKIKETYPDLELIAGNVATPEGVRALIEKGVDAVKIGVGPGSICTTRIVRRCRCAADVSHNGMLRRSRKTRCSAYCRRRYKILRRYDEGYCRRSRLYHDRQPFWRH